MMDAPFPAGMVEDIARVIDGDREPAGLDLYEGVFESGLMFPLQRKDELRAMMQLARSVDPTVVVEIGADKGGGCYHWLKCLGPMRFAGIEIRGTPYGPLLDRAFPETDCLWLARSSYDPETVALVRRWLHGDLIDVLFVDGDKARFHEDFVAYVEMVRTGGLVLMHDVRDAAPLAAFRRAAEHERVRDSIIFESTLEVLDAVARELDGHPSRNAHEAWLRQWRGRSCGVGVLWC